MNYQTLLSEADQEARTEYTYDPRVVFLATAQSQTPAEPRDPIGHTEVADQQETIDELTADEYRETLTAPVQDQPEMTPRKRIVVIDTSQRDWTVQPDAYSNIFSFGTQQPQRSDGPQVPFYFNNVTIPLSAYETPLSVLKGAAGSGVLNDIPSVPNNVGLPFPPGIPLPAYVSTTAQGLVSPKYGWKLVFKSGQLIHSPTTFSYSDPTVQVFFYPNYDPRQPAGAQIGIDIQPKRYGINNYVFSTQLALSNVTEIKLARAIMPVRGTQNYKGSTFSTNIQYPDSFHTQSYLLMTIQNLRGNYYGGAQIVQQSFSVLAQNTRNLYDGNTVYPSQYSDYYPWKEESYTFDPPLAKLSNANIQIYNNAGIPFSQIDNLNIIDIVIDPINLGQVKFFVTQNMSNSTTGGFSDSNIFLGTDIRIGDEIKFYQPAVTQIEFDSSSTKALTSFFNLLSNNFLVTSICGADFTPRYVFPTSDVGTSFTAVPKLTSGYAGMSNAVATICGLLQTLSQVCLMQYSGITQPKLAFAGSRTFSQDYVIPILNINTQSTYVLEITSLEPDPTNIKKIIPN